MKLEISFEKSEISLEIIIINKTPITHRYNSNKIHGLSKKHLYSENIIKYVNTNEGCSLKEISNDINNKLSLSTYFF